MTFEEATEAWAFCALHALRARIQRAKPSTPDHHRILAEMRKLESELAKDDERQRMRLGH
jgi:hypothetical protein